MEDLQLATPLKAKQGLGIRKTLRWKICWWQPNQKHNKDSGGSVTQQILNFHHFYHLENTICSPLLLATPLKA